VDGRLLDCTDGECCTNLSVNGMFLRTARSYPVNAQVQLQLALNDQEVSAEARIVHCQEPEDGCGGIWGIGLEFLRTSPEAGEIIRGFINDEVTHGMDRSGEEEAE
jgi:hypothetical protein